MTLETLTGSWMDMLPMSTLSEEQRQNQYLPKWLKRMLIDKQGVWNYWIRTQKRLETDGMLHK